jgi:hypothetical protein
MKALMFIKTKDNQYLFKADTFWSKSITPRGAKVYNDNSKEDIEGWLKSGILPWSIYKSKVDEVIEKYSDGVLGYFTPDESLFETQYSVKENTEVKDLGKPNYLYILRIKPLDEWIIGKEDNDLIYPKNAENIYFDDYIQLDRDNKIENILK